MAGWSNGRWAVISISSTRVNGGRAAGRDLTAGPDQAVSIYPPLGFREGSLEERSRRAVPARELWGFHQSLASQLEGLPNGTTVEFVVDD